MMRSGRSRGAWRTSLVCVPIARTVRSIPTELPLGTDDGMPVECAAAFDNLRTIPKHALTERIATLSPDRVGDPCRALRIAVRLLTAAT